MQSPDRQPAPAEQPSASATGRSAGCGVLLLGCSVDEQAAKSTSKNELQTSALRSVGLVRIVIV
jgi:hypothetical protein